MNQRARRDTEGHGAKWQRGRRLKPSARADAAKATVSQLQREGRALLERCDEVDVGSSSWAQQKLVYDELLRYQRSRAADIETLVGLQQQIQIDGRSPDLMKQHAACRFREEWRIGEPLVC